MKVFFYIPSCSNSLLSASCLASRVNKSTFNDWWRFACTPSEFRTSTIWDTTITKHSLCTYEDIFIKWVCCTLSRQSTLTMYFSIWDFNSEGSTSVFTIALKSSSIFLLNNGRHSLEVLIIISLMFSLIISVVWH